jgi:hypothetical protein
MNADRPDHGKPIRDLGQLIRQMNPALQDQVIVFCRMAPGDDDAAAGALGMFHETEGVTLMVPEAIAKARGWEVLFRAAHIILRVPSDLMAVGFLAAVLGELAGHGISCNPVSAACHDHLFVPYDRGSEALGILLAMQGRDRKIGPM